MNQDHTEQLNVMFPTYNSMKVRTSQSTLWLEAVDKVQRAIAINDKQRDVSSEYDRVGVNRQGAVCRSTSRNLEEYWVPFRASSPEHLRMLIHTSHGSWSAVKLALAILQAQSIKK